MWVADQSEPAKVIRTQDVAEAPWANGRGRTREIYKQAQDDRLAWRLSLATIQSPGPFSVLPGVRRTLLLASGDILRLSVNGCATTLHHTESVVFDGAADVEVVSAPDGCQALNLMTGDCLDGRLEVRQLIGTTELSDRDAAAVVVLSGRLGVADQSLSPFDTLVLGRQGIRIDAASATAALVLLGNVHVHRPTTAPLE
ncbi:HutD/Ves family protein [Actinoplanes sp. URMC 104]|uniref:HutD/Ves family protein n=1 Tax=Actinoplanes sp. URMC 104 TaxID=3423409 RepID=UPI003F1BECD9